MREVPIKELCIYLRLLYEALGLLETTLSGERPTFDDLAMFFARYDETAGYCDIVNRENGGILLLIDELEHPEKYA